ncbi:MAG: TraC family protein [Caldisericum sp.]
MQALKEALKQKFDFFAEVIGLKKSEIEDNYLSNDELKKLFGRNSFSKYLPYVAYDSELGIYYNADNTIGLLFFCDAPLIFSSEKSLNALESLLKMKYPSGSILQVILVADDFVDHILENYLRRKTAPSFAKKALEKLCDHFRKSAHGETNLLVRNFILFVAVKIPITNDLTINYINELKAMYLENFSSAGMALRVAEPSYLLFFLRRLLNNKEWTYEDFENGRLTRWYPTTRLSKQIIYADTEIKRENNFIKINDKYVGVMSFKSLPEKANLLFGNYVSGVYDLIDGRSGDSFQVPSPFYVCFTVYLDNVKTEIISKGNLILQQQAFGTFYVKLKQKVDEYLWATNELESGKTFHKAYFTFVIYDKDKEKLFSSIYRYKRILESLGGEVQIETFLNLPMFLYSLPFGVVPDKSTRFILDREFVLPSDTVSCIMPIQADFVGTGEPALIFTGRKGQLVSIDIFSQRSPNYNFYIAAPSGKGKSFTANYIVVNYLLEGARVRIVDIGGSYRKLTKMFNGAYLEFTPDANFSLNPFLSIKDLEQDLPAVIQILISMATAVTEELPHNISRESAYNVMHVTVEELLKAKSPRDLLIDDIYEYLVNFTKYFPDRDILCSEEKSYCEENFTLIASHLAFNLRKFTTQGIYGKWFNGENILDLSGYDFVVLELENLKRMPDLFKVVVLTILNHLTAELYLSDRTRPTLILVDEAWQFLQDTPSFAKIIEEGYRRARKYRGSFSIITQSVLDFEGFGSVGRIIDSNSAFKFYLESTDFDRAYEKKLLSMDEFSLQLLKSIRYNAPRYSEIFVKTDSFGEGVIRLVVDPYSYYVFTSNPAEIAAIEQLVSQGLSYEEAIDHLVSRSKNQNQKER